MELQSPSEDDKHELSYRTPRRLFNVHTQQEEDYSYLFVGQSAISKNNSNFQNTPSQSSNNDFPLSSLSDTAKSKDEWIQNLISKRQKENSRNVNDCLKKAKKQLEQQLSNIKQNPHLNKENVQRNYNANNFVKLNNLYENLIKEPRRITKRSHSQTHTRSLSRSRKTKEQLILEKEENFKQQCTFQPKINKPPRGSQYIDKQHWLKRLSTPKTEAQERREKLKRELEDSITKECTFQPKINQSTGSLNSSLNRSSYMSVQDRLYYDAEKFSERERLKRFMDEQEQQSYPFQPQIRSKSVIKDLKNYKPIYQRYEEVLKNKNETLKQAQIEREKNDPNMTFTPKINQRSATLAVMKKERCGDSSLNPTQYTNQGLSSTFSSQNTSASARTVDFESFYERQMQTLKKAKDKRQIIREQLDKQCSFKPRISQSSQYIAQLHNRGDQGDIVERLSTMDWQRRQEAQQSIHEQFYDQYDFKPKINNISKQIAQKTNIEELAYNRKVLEARKKMAEARAAEKDNQCSFKPTINTENKKYQKIQSNYSQNSDIIGIIENQSKKKQDKIAVMKQIQEAQEQKQCTFQPESNISKIDFDQEVEIKGMDRFMEVRAMAKRMQLEQQQREEKVFITNPQPIQQPFTIPQPYNLHPSQKEKKLQKIIDEVNSKLSKDLTFRPEILKSNTNSKLYEDLPYLKY